MKKNLTEEWRKKIQGIFKEAEEMDLDTTADDSGVYPDEPVSDELDSVEERPETITLTKDLLSQLLHKAAGHDDESEDNGDEELPELGDDDVENDEEENDLDEKKHYQENDEEETEVTDDDGSADITSDLVVNDIDTNGFDVESVVNKAVEMSQEKAGEPLDVDSFELLVAPDDDNNIDADDTEVDDVEDVANSDEVDDLDEKDYRDETGDVPGEQGQGPEFKRTNGRSDYKD